MVNAIKAAARFIDRLPAIGCRRRRPAATTGYVHPYQLDASVDRTTVKVLMRDFVTAALSEKEALVEQIAARGGGARRPGTRVESRSSSCTATCARSSIAIPKSWSARATAIRRAGIEPDEKPIRGGTDGSRLSFMGLPTPNLFAGEHNFHSRLEWTSRQDLERAVDVIVALAQVWADG